MGEKYFQESDLRIWVTNMSGIWSWLWVHKIVLTGGLPPPCSSWGASSPPDPLAGGLQPPVLPRRFLRGSASQALRFLGYQHLGTRTLKPEWNQNGTNVEPTWNQNRTQFQRLEPKWNQHSIAGTKWNRNSKM